MSNHTKGDRTVTQFTRRFLAGCSLMLVAGRGVGAPLQEDRKNHGPLDGHPVMVFQLLQGMDLPEETLSACQEVASQAQKQWRAWYDENRDKVRDNADRVRKLKEDGDRKELARVRREKKEFMHTAPSLLRKPEPLKAVLSQKQYADFIPKLDELKRRLHQPKRKSKTADK
jgi:hypothetical protein